MKLWSDAVRPKLQIVIPHFDQLRVGDRFRLRSTDELPDILVSVHESPYQARIRLQHEFHVPCPTALDLWFDLDTKGRAHPCCSPPGASVSPFLLQLQELFVHLIEEHTFHLVANRYRPLPEDAFRRRTS